MKHASSVPNSLGQVLAACRVHQHRLLMHATANPDRRQSLTGAAFRMALNPAAFRVSARTWHWCMRAPRAGSWASSCPRTPCWAGSPSAPGPPAMTAAPRTRWPAAPARFSKQVSRDGELASNTGLTTQETLRCGIAAAAVKASRRPAQSGARPVIREQRTFGKSVKRPCCTCSSSVNAAMAATSGRSRRLGASWRTVCGSSKEAEQHTYTVAALPGLVSLTQ